MKANPVGRSGGEARHAVGEGTTEALRTVCCFVERGIDTGCVDGAAGRPAGGGGRAAEEPVVAKIGQGSRRVGGDRALVDDLDGVDVPPVAAADGTGVAADRYPGSDRERLVGGAAAAGAETVVGVSSEDEVAGSVDGLRSPFEEDLCGREGVTVADADGGSVERQAVADGDRSAGDIEVAGEGDAGEAAAR